MINFLKLIKKINRGTGDKRATANAMGWGL